MIPFLHFGSLNVPTFGLMVATAMACAYLVLRADIFRRGLAPDKASAAATAETFIAFPCLAGIAGAKLYHELQSPGEFFAHPLQHMFSQYGFAWFGGLLAGFAAYAWLAWMRRIPLLEMFDAGSPAAALGYGIGRIGCFLSGDGDYGIPTSLPWGMSFPNGLVPDHRTRPPDAALRIDRRLRDRLVALAAGSATNCQPIRGGGIRIAAVVGAIRKKGLAGQRRAVPHSARRNLRGLPDSHGTRAFPGGIYPHQPALVPGHVQRPGRRIALADRRRSALVANPNQPQRVPSPRPPVARPNTVGCNLQRRTLRGISYPASPCCGFP